MRDEDLSSEGIDDKTLRSQPDIFFFGRRVFTLPTTRPMEYSNLLSEDEGDVDSGIEADQEEADSGIEA